MPERLTIMTSFTKGPRVLHVGCVGGSLPNSPGERLHWVHGALVDAGFSVLGVDIDREALKEIEDARFEVMYMDARDMPPDGEKFDSIFAGELIEHLENPGLFLSGCRRRLKIDGRLILSTPNVWSPMYALHYLKRGHKTAHPQHTVWFDAQVLSQMLERCGFKIIRIEYVDDLRPETAGSRFYQAFAMVWTKLRKVLPKRYRNDLVVWAELAH